MRKIFVALCLVTFIAVLTAVSADVKQPSGNVVINFDGLQALCFGKSDSVGVGVLNVPHHTPQLLILQHHSDSTKEVARLMGADLNGLTIGLSGDQHSVTRFKPGMDNAKDFRWNIDMESDIFQKQLNLNEKALIAKIKIKDGQFYSANLSEEKYTFRSETTQLPFNRSVGEPAASINIPQGGSLVISGGKEPIVLEYADNVSYEIQITNLPPRDMANMNHFLFYFDLIGDKVTRYEPVLIEKAAFSPRPIVCAAIVFSRSTIN